MKGEMIILRRWFLNDLLLRSTPLRLDNTVCITDEESINEAKKTEKSSRIP